MPAWDTVPAASPGANATLRAVADLGGTNVWAVGNARPDPLIERWNGSAFVRVPVAGVAGRDSVLEGVDGVSPNDVWAVGHADRTDFVGSTSLSFRWNGTTWTRVPSPNAGDSEAANNLLDVAAVSATDAWAVGQYSDISGFRAIILPWDGVAWRNVANRCGWGLNGVTALAANDVWAVGAATICHWNGPRWRPQRAPTLPNRSMNLQDIDGVPGALWAVGIETGSCGEGVCGGGIVLRRSGTTWVREVPGYNLSDVKVLAPNDAWAVGIWAYGPLPPPSGRDVLAAGALARHRGDRKPGGRGRLGAEVTLGGRAADLGQQITSSGTHATLALRAPSARSGAVVGDSNGHATVTWIGPESGSVEADQFGEFRVGGLDVGSYTFIASQQGCSPASRQLSIVAGTTIAVTLLPRC